MRNLLLLIALGFGLNSMAQENFEFNAVYYSNKYRGAEGIIKLTDSIIQIDNDKYNVNMEPSKIGKNYYCTEGPGLIFVWNKIDKVFVVILPTGGQITYSIKRR